MNYTVIPNLYGYDNGAKGTYDDFFDTDKYKTHPEAVAAGDYVQCDYTKDENNMLGVKIHHSKHPGDITHYTMSWQRPVAGRDILDDNQIGNIADALLEKYK